MVALLLFAAIVLVAGLAFNLAYLDTGGEQLPATPTSSPNPGSAGILDEQTASEIFFVVFLAIAVSAVILLFLRRKQGIPVRRVLRPTTWMDLVAMLIAFTVFALILVLWPRVVNAVQPPGTAGAGRTNGTGNATAFPALGGLPLGAFLAGSLFVAIVVIALLFRVGSGLLGQPPKLDRGTPRYAAAQAVQATIEQLQLGEDVRQAILACYGRFCVLLGARGLGSQEALTPREIEDRAVHRLGVSPDSSDALTSLFEEARYSEHALGDADRDRAVRSLERIRADLEV